jgi:hypothetical protein
MSFFSYDVQVVLVVVQEIKVPNLVQRNEVVDEQMNVNVFRFLMLFLVRQTSRQIQWIYLIG